MNFYKFLKDRDFGFTLVEILVVVAIIGIISAVVLVSFQGGSREAAVKRAAQKVALDIRRAQNLALASKEYPGATPAVPYGWGVYFCTSSCVAGFTDPTRKYRLYANIGPLTTMLDPADPFEEILLDRNIVIAELQADGTPYSMVFAYFCPPDPSTFLRRSGATDGNACDASSVTNPAGNIIIRLGHQQAPSIRRDVVVTKTGLVEVRKP